MLHDFIIENRDLIIERARQRVRVRAMDKPTDAKVENGIPLFLTQLADAMAATASEHHGLQLVGAADSRRRITESAALHGHELLRHGFTVAQVVHGYGDVCQIVTELASEMKAPISAQEFHAFNLCLDDAIAGAVTEYGGQRERDLAYEGTERLGILAHELRNLLNTAILSFDILKKGTVGLGGSTGAIHARSLAGLHALVERSLAEVRLNVGTASLEPVSVAEVMEELEISAAMHAEGRGLQLVVQSVGGDVMIDADRQLLASAVSNLLQNAFKYTKPNGTVTLRARATGARVTIAVSDECGGLPPGKVDALFKPFTQNGADRSGLGLGLSIALSAARANSGEILVEDMPGKGCVFTIDLPRKPSPAGRTFHVLPDDAHGSSPTSDASARGAHSRKLSR